MESVLALLGLLLFIAPVISLVLGLSQRGRVTQLEEQLRRQQELLRVQQDHLRVLGDELRAIRNGQVNRGREVPAPPLPRPVKAPAEEQTEVPSAGPSAAPALPEASAGRPIEPPAPERSTPLTETFPTPPPPPAGPPRPNWLREFVTGPGGFARLGAVMLLIGVGFLLKYASDTGWIGLPFRLGVIVVGALGLFGVGWRLRHTRPGYAVALQGTAFGVLYLTTFAAFRLYGLLPPTPAFLLLAALGAVMCLLAVRQEAQVLAGLGVLGAFLAPVLANGGSSGGGGGPAALFGYYLLVNAGVFALAWWRDWRPLYLLGFVSTFVVGTGWGVLSYEPGQFAATEPFLLLFTLLYAAIPVLEAWRGRREGGAVQSALLFGTPAVFLALQAGLLGGARVGLAVSALAVALAYGLVAFWLHRRRSTPLLWHGHAAVSAAALTLAIPFALGQDAFLGAWALLAAALAWFGGRGRWRGWTAAGLALYGLTAALCLAYLTAGSFFFPLPSLALLLNGLLIGAAGVLAAWAAGPLGRGWTLAPGGIGVALWLLAGGAFLAERTSPADAWVTLFVAGSGALAAGVWPRLKVEALRWSALLPLTAALVLAGARLSTADGPWWPDPLLRLGWLAFPLALAAGGWAVRRARLDPEWPDRLSTWLAVVLAAVWASVRALSLGEPWPQAALLAVPLAGFLAYTLGFIRNPKSHASWRGTWLPVLGVALLWPLLSAGLSGRVGGGLFLPLLNPVDLASLAVLVVAWASLTRVGARRWPGAEAAFAPLRERLPARTVPRVLGALSVLALSLAVVRAAGNLSGVPYDLGPLFDSSEVQVALTVAWAVVGLAGMVWASKRGVREAWLIGAALLGASAVKLFLIDLGGVSAPARIVSFLAVGGLFLLVGYVSPAPPSEEGRGKAV